MSLQQTIDQALEQSEGIAPLNPVSTQIAAHELVRRMGLVAGVPVGTRVFTVHEDRLVCGRVIGYGQLVELDREAAAANEAAGMYPWADGIARPIPECSLQVRLDVPGGGAPDGFYRLAPDLTQLQPGWCRLHPIDCVALVAMSKDVLARIEATPTGVAYTPPAPDEEPAPDKDSAPAAG